MLGIFGGCLQDQSCLTRDTSFWMLLDVWISRGTGCLLINNWNYIGKDRIQSFVELRNNEYVCIKQRDGQAYLVNLFKWLQSVHKIQRFRQYWIELSFILLQPYQFQQVCLIYKLRTLRWRWVLWINRRLVQGMKLAPPPLQRAQVQPSYYLRLTKKI